MKRFELEEEERIVLQTLAKRGAMSPSEVAAETWTLPGKTLSVLRELSSAGFVHLRNEHQQPGWSVGGHYQPGAGLPERHPELIGASNSHTPFRTSPMAPTPLNEITFGQRTRITRGMKATLAALVVIGLNIGKPKSMLPIKKKEGLKESAPE